MKPSKNFFSLIVTFEGLRTRAYLDSIGLPTIGIGTTIYPDGKHVRIGDRCTESQAYEYLEHDLLSRVRFLNSILPFPVNQNQFDAMLSLIYNIGVGAFKSSTAYKRIIADQFNPNIREAWMRWNKATVKGVLKEIPGLTTRRRKECDLYFKAV